MVELMAPKIVDFWCTPDMIGKIARGARVCYQSEEHSLKTNEEMVGMLLEKKHLPMFDHVHATVIINTNRGVTHEIVRHRMAAYAQESTRYCNYSSNRFNNSVRIVPSCKIQIDDMDEYVVDMETIEGIYMKWINKKYPAQIARDFLPQATKSQIEITADITEWFHIFRLRTAQTAHPDMRIIMESIMSRFMEEPDLRFIMERAIELKICI